jgi:KUP system potassium uptake protein
LLCWASSSAISVRAHFIRKTVLGLTGANPDPTTTLGALSLVIWTLIVDDDQVRIDPAMLSTMTAMGILALMSLLRVKRQHRPVIVAVGLFRAALI